jgi:hypothetical protein
MRLGVDLGGTKTEIVALDDDGTEFLRERVATDPSSYDAVLATIAGLVTRAESKLWRTGTVGVGIPGTISARTRAREERELDRAQRPRPRPGPQPCPQSGRPVHERRQLPGPVRSAAGYMASGCANPGRYFPAGTRFSVPDPYTSRFSIVTASATRSGPKRKVTPLSPAAISPTGW